MTARLAIGAVALSPAGPRIVAAGGETEVDALAAAAGADVVELRADLFADPRPDALPALLERVRAGGRPAILTVRAAPEGGHVDDDALRRSLYRAGLPHADAIDVEVESAALVEDLVPRARALGRTVILSAHVLDATPDEAALHRLVDRARALGADVTKVATYARDLDALRRLVAFTLAARAHGVVTLAMGPMGPLSRVVLPAAGSVLTYAHVGRPTAPSGQIALAELAPLMRRLFP